jgi:hypothetical protein
LATYRIGYRLSAIGNRQSASDAIESEVIVGAFQQHISHT